MLDSQRGARTVVSPSPLPIDTMTRQKGQGTEWQNAIVVELRRGELVKNSYAAVRQSTEILYIEIVNVLPVVLPTGRRC